MGKYCDVSFANYGIISNKHHLSNVLFSSSCTPSYQPDLCAYPVLPQISQEGLESVGIVLTVKRLVEWQVCGSFI